MSEETPMTLDDLIQVEVDRAVAPYVGRIPPFALAKMRELAERYWREHPQASRALRNLEKKKRVIRSGTEASSSENGAGEAAGGQEKV